MDIFWNYALHFFSVYIMNVNYAKFQKKFDSRTISRELPYINIIDVASVNHSPQSIPLVDTQSILD